MKRTFTKYPSSKVTASNRIDIKDRDVTLREFFESANEWAEEPVDASQSGVQITITPYSDGEYSVRYDGINSPMGNDERVTTLGDLFQSFDMFFRM